MRTDLISFILASENRKNVVKAILENPKRQWSCTWLEGATKLPHATVYRTIKGLRDFGILRWNKVNKRDLLYRLLEDPPIVDELKKVLNLEQFTAKQINLATNMAKRNDELQKLKPRIVMILKKNGIKKAGVFGSFARGEQKKDSDIDIIIQPTKNMGFAFAGLEIELSDKLGKKVDLVSYNGLSPYLKDKILGQEVRII